MENVWCTYHILISHGHHNIAIYRRKYLTFQLTQSLHRMTLHHNSNPNLLTILTTTETSTLIFLSPLDAKTKPYTKCIRFAITDLQEISMLYMYT